jgi:hypothetical protein
MGHLGQPVIEYPEAFDRSLPAGFDGVFEWDFLRGCFGPTIMPMDFDAVVERKGNFLVFETKDAGVPIKDGQRRTLTELIKRPHFTVIILRGKREANIDGFTVWQKGRVSRHPHADADDLRAYCTAWFAWADQHERTP